MKKFALIFVAVILVLSLSVEAFAYNRNYSNWFDLNRINAVDCRTDLTREATREEVALLVAYLAEELEVLSYQRFLTFNDANSFVSATSYQMIQRLSSTGIVTGYPNGSFGPGNNITRAEALAIIIRTIDYFGLETNQNMYRNSGCYFTDTKGHWAETYCNRAYIEGLVQGRGNGCFYPNDDITREEIITILVNLMGDSNNPLISAIDQVYDLEFSNSRGTDSNRGMYSRQTTYNNRSGYYYDDYYDCYNDYESKTSRPVVDTGNSGNSVYTGSTSSSSYTQYEPERPVVDLSGFERSAYEEPQRPVVDLTNVSSVANTSSVSTIVAETERPTISSTGSFEEPTRPVVNLS